VDEDLDRPAIGRGQGRERQIDLLQREVVGDQRTKRQHTIPHGFDQLQRSGTLDNLRLAAGADGRYRAAADTSGTILPFLDSDVYKWLEAVGWELGRPPDPALAAAADEAIGLVAAAQRADGYLNSYVQVVTRGTPHTDLAWGHELYCIGHLIQAAAAGTAPSATTGGGGRPPRHRDGPGRADPGHGRRSLPGPGRPDAGPARPWRWPSSSATRTC
jgi:DUF1680 family protein